MAYSLRSALVALTALAVVIIAGPANAETYRLKIASGHNMNWHFIQLAHEFFVPEFKKRVAERTDHEVNILEGYASAIVKATEVLEGAQSGIVDLGLFCYCHEGGKLALHNFPYYAPFTSPSPDVSVKATRATYDAIPQLQEILMKDNNQRNLALIPIDNYDVISKFPFTKVSEMKGHKVGGAGPNLPWAERVGAAPVSVTGPEFYTAFQTGLFDSALAFVSIMDSLKLYPIAKYYVQVNFGSMSILGLNANLDAFNKLPKEIQDILVETARDMEVKSGPFTQEVYDRYLGIIEKNGAEVIKFPEDQRKAWAEALATWPNERAGEIEKETGAPMKATLNAYLAAVEKEGYTWPVRYKVE